MSGFGIFVMVIGLLLCLVGGLWTLLLAFKKHIGWGIGCLLFSPIWLVFTFMHWPITKRAFKIWAIGFVAALLGNFIAGIGGS